MPVAIGSAHRLPGGDAGRDDVHLAGLAGADVALAVEGDAQRVDDAADEFVTDGHFEESTGRLDAVAFLELEVVAVDDGTDGVFFEVEDLADDAAFELEEFAGHGILEAVDAGDAVTDFDDGADFADAEPVFEAGDFALEDAGDFGNVDGHDLGGGGAESVTGGAAKESGNYFSRRSRIASSWRRTLASMTWSPTLRTRPPMISGSTYW